MIESGVSHLACTVSSMQDENTQWDVVSLEDVELAAMLARDRRTPEALAYRNRLIAECYLEGDVVWDYLVWATGLSKGSLRRIVRSYQLAKAAAAEPAAPPWPIGDLRSVPEA